MAAAVTAASGLVSLPELCRDAVLGITGVSLVVCSDPRGTARMQIAAVGRLAEYAEQLQIDLGEGPCIEAFTTNAAVLAPDLDRSPTAADWPVYAREALNCGIRAAFAFPVQVHMQPLGVLSLYRDLPGILTADQTEWSMAYSAAAGILLLDDVHDLTVTEDGESHARISPAVAVIQHAVGVLMARHGFTDSGALAYLRAYAYSHGRVLAHVANAVVEQRLTFAEKDLP